MKWRDIVHLAFLQFHSNKTRHILCLSAVTIGAFSMILLFNIGSFAERQVSGMIDSLGLQGLSVYINDAKNGELLTTAFAEYLEDEITCIEAATPIKFAAGSYKSGHKNGSVALIGCEEDISSTLGIKLVHGRGLSDEKIVDVQNPLVVSSHFAKSLYNRDNVIGKQLYITISGNQERFTIVGVIEDQVSLSTGITGSFMPEFAYVSIAKISSLGAADQILLSAEEKEENILPILQDCAERAFGMQSDLAVQNLSGYEEKIDEMMEKTKLVLSFFGGLSMIVAAFAIENSMISAMQEMRDELILYRVIGFRRYDILRFFLIQAVMLCAAGALAGSVIGWAAIEFVRNCFISSFRFDSVQFFMVLLIVIGAGAVAGAIPAFQVLSQIKKERYE